MITIEIPEFRHLELEHIVLDYNGTIADALELFRNPQRLIATLRC